MTEIDFEADAQAIEQSAPEDRLEKIRIKAEEYLDVSQEIEVLNQLLKEKTERRRYLEEVEIPSLFDEAQVRGVDLKDNRRIIVEPFVHANIPKKNAEEAFDWLEENGHGDLIKQEIKARLGRGELEIARTAVKILQDLGLSPIQEKMVAWNTLTAWAKEQLAAGTSIPLELLGIYQGKRAKIK